MEPTTRTVESLITKLAHGEKTVLDIVSDHGAKKLEFGLARLAPPPPPEPVRAETMSRAHQFFEAGSFAAYLARYGKPKDAVVYADPSTETVWAILEESGGKGVEQLTFRPQLHPLWKPWSEIVGHDMPLSDFREFLMAHRQAVFSPPGRALSLMLNQIRGAVEVTIHDGRGRNALNGIVVRSNVQGTETRETVEIPEEVTLRVPLYVGCEVQDVELDLVVDADPSGGVTVMVAAGGVEEARVLAFDAMLAVIREGLKAIDATVGYGKPQHTPWRYLDPVKA